MAVVGDNGAGKSTLIKILSGVHAPDEGEILFEGRHVAIQSPTHARRLGIETVYQDLALIESLSIARTFFLGAEPVRRLGPVGLLDQATMISIALDFGAKMIIGDEPSSALSIKYARKVLNYIREVNARGLSIIFITHNLAHVYPVADVIIVLYHGRKVGEFRKGGVDPDVIEALIIGGGDRLAS